MTVIFDDNDEDYQYYTLGAEYIMQLSDIQRDNNDSSLPSTTNSSHAKLKSSQSAPSHLCNCYMLGNSLSVSSKSDAILKYSVQVVDNYETSDSIIFERRDLPPNYANKSTQVQIEVAACSMFSVIMQEVCTKVECAVNLIGKVNLLISVSFYFNISVQIREFVRRYSWRSLFKLF